MKRAEQMNDKNSVQVDKKTSDDSSVLGGMKNTKTCLQAHAQPLGIMGALEGMRDKKTDVRSQ